MLIFVAPPAIIIVLAFQFNITAQQRNAVIIPAHNKNVDAATKF